MEYNPLSEYGAIGDGNTVALVGRDGSIDWCPLPHVESSSVFAAILDADHGGRFAVRPTLSFESVLEYAGPLGLFAAAIDPETGEQRGNFPQAYSHTGLINSVLSLADAENSSGGSRRPLGREPEDGGLSGEIVRQPTDAEHTS